LPEHLDYQSRTNERGSSRRNVAISISIVCAVVILANVALLVLAAYDKEAWADLAVAAMLGPLTNGIIALDSLIFIPLVKHLSRGRSILFYVLVSILFPLLAIGVDYEIITGGFLR
jgi:hypothetical protein